MCRYVMNSHTNLAICKLMVVYESFNLKVTAVDVLINTVNLD